MLNYTNRLYHGELVQLLLDINHRVNFSASFGLISAPHNLEFWQEKPHGQRVPLLTATNYGSTETGAVISNRRDDRQASCRGPDRASLQTWSNYLMAAYSKLLCICGLFCSTTAELVAAGVA